MSIYSIRFCCFLGIFALLNGVAPGVCLGQPAEKADSLGYFVERPGAFLDRLVNRATRFESKMTKKTEAYLSGMKRKEKKIYRKLLRKDSSAAKALFANIDSSYAGMKNTAKQKADELTKYKRYYVGALDSISTSLAFIKQSGNITDGLKSNPLFADAEKQIGSLQGKFGEMAELNSLLSDRTKLLQSQLGKYGLSKQLLGLRKKAYYYQQQIADYKAALKDPNQLAMKVIRLAQKAPAFESFFLKNSQLTALFSLPGGADPQGSLASMGLQQRSMVERELSQRLGVNGPNMEQNLLEDLRANTGQLDQLKQKAKGLLSGEKGNAGDMPDFSPNAQKTKSFLKRIEYGANIQTVKSSQYFPSTSDLGMSLGYKLSGKSVIGIGGSYKMGWGQDIRHIAISHQGLGLRSFVDIKIKGSVWLSGGSEWNYRQNFNNLEILTTFPSWQQSALLGLQKKFSGGRLKSNLQLLYDFLWREQNPRGQPVSFRVGYTIK